MAIGEIDAFRAGLAQQRRPFEGALPAADDQHPPVRETLERDEVAGVIVAFARQHRRERLGNMGEVSEAEREHDEAAAQGSPAAGQRSESVFFAGEPVDHKVEGADPLPLPEPGGVTEVEIAGQGFDIATRLADGLEVGVNRMGIQRVERPVAGRTQEHVAGHVVGPEAHWRADHRMRDAQVLRASRER